MNKDDVKITLIDENDLEKTYIIYKTEKVDIQEELTKSIQQLQKELENLKQINEQHRILNGKLRIEEENLQDQVNALETVKNSLLKENKQLKDGWQQEVKNKDEILNKWLELERRINKATEYIHNHQPVFELSSKEQIQEWFEKEYYVELLKTLKGE